MGVSKGTDGSQAAQSFLAQLRIKRSVTAVGINNLAGKLIKCYKLVSFYF